jgi:hypothetical protein
MVEFFSGAELTEVPPLLPSNFLHGYERLRVRFTANRATATGGSSPL